MVQSTYELLNNAWKSTAKVLFTSEIGELKDFEPYLKGAAIGKTVKSYFSGNPLWMASEHYDSKAKFFDFNTEQNNIATVSATPIDINKIKDIDSLMDEIKERIIYSGNKTLGNSKYVEHSDAVVDSTGILNSSIVVRSKYLAYCYLKRESEYAFGCTSSGESTHMIRCFYNNTLKRCFEASTSVGSADCYFVYNLIACSDCMFTFNIRSKRQMIGNVQLTRDEYSKLKPKLISEMAEKLKKNKKFDFSIMDLVNGQGKMEN